MLWVKKYNNFGFIFYWYDVVFLVIFVMFFVIFFKKLMVFLDSVNIYVFIYG